MLSGVAYRAGRQNRNGGFLVSQCLLCKMATVSEGSTAATPGQPSLIGHALARAVRDLGNARVTARYNEEHNEKLPTGTVTAGLTR
jgi:hypothetical protein